MTNGQRHTRRDGCDWCGTVHIKQHHCEYDLHGKDDFLKACCAACEDELESGEQRGGDKFGNIYCGEKCKSLGAAILTERVGELP